VIQGARAASAAPPQIARGTSADAAERGTASKQRPASSRWSRPAQQAEAPWGGRFPARCASRAAPPNRRLIDQPVDAHRPSWRSPSQSLSISALAAALQPDSPSMAGAPSSSCRAARWRKVPQQGRDRRATASDERLGDSQQLLGCQSDRIARPIPFHAAAVVAAFAQRQARHRSPHPRAARPRAGGDRSDARSRDRPPRARWYRRWPHGRITRACRRSSSHVASLAGIEPPARPQAGRAQKPRSQAHHPPAPCRSTRERSALPITRLPEVSAGPPHLACGTRASV